MNRPYGLRKGYNFFYVQTTIFQDPVLFPRHFHGGDMVGVDPAAHRVPQAVALDEGAAVEGCGDALPEAGDAHGRGDDQGGAVPLGAAGCAAARDHG